jgi:hypothetical protein
VKKIFFCLLFVNSLSANAQSLKWHEGSVVLTSGDVIVGKMVVDPFLDVVLFQENDRRTVYPAHKVRSLYYYDDSYDINRRFISLREENFPYNHHQLFEVVVCGEVNVLRKQKTRFLNSSDALDFTYYVSYRDDVVLLRKFGKKIYPQLKSSMEKLDDFVSANHLREYDSSNSITIIEYYNRQLLTETITAKH